MKRTIIGTILGLATVASSYGDGFVNWDNYFNSSIATTANSIKYANDPLLGTDSGLFCGSEINVELYYSLGNTAATFAQLSPIPSTVMAINGGGGENVFPVMPGPNTDEEPGPGVYAAGEIIIPGWSATGIDRGTVTFAVAAFNGASYATSTIRGVSGLWTESPWTGMDNGSISSTLSLPIQEMLNGPLGVTVDIVPEPSTFGLLEVGGAALFFFRRIK